MDILTLDVQTRDSQKKAKELLREDIIPIEYYGKGLKNKSLQTDYQIFRKLFRVAGTNTVVELNIGGKEKVNVLIYKVQRNPITDLITHVDVKNVKMDEQITAKIPLKFVGISLAVKDEGGILMHQINEIDVKCLPGDLIHEIEVSIEPLIDFSCYVRVKDLVVPEKIVILNDPEDVVVTAVPPREEEEETPVAVEGEVKEGEGGEGEAKEGEETEEEGGDENKE